MSITRLVVVSNRLPIVIRKGLGGDWEISSGSGGLVTALAPVLRDRGGLWIGWPGAPEVPPKELSRLLERGAAESGYALGAVDLTETEVEKYYHGFSNEILWPLFHDIPSRCNFDPSYWPYYQQVNRKMAEVIARSTTPDDYIWIQDYHLMLVAHELRKLGVTRNVGFFLHIPFPPLDLYLKLPWRFQVLEGLLDFDLVGFQTMRDKRNFLPCARALVSGTRMKGAGQVSWLTTPDREVRVGAFPISIDYHEFARAAETQEVSDRAWLIHEDLPNRQIILGVDRLDYTKGIPERIRAYARALELYPELRRKTTLFQVVVPSRTDVEEYRKLKSEIEQLVGQVNGRFTEAGWTPIHYLYRSLPRLELVAYYRTCEIALVTPLKDGMNLVAKEFCASSLEGRSVLILSEFAGAAAQLRDGAILVNPHDIDGVAEAIHRAYWMNKDERKDRMHRLQTGIQKQNIYNWVGSFLRAAIAKNLDDFPPVEMYVPENRERI